MDFLNEHLVSLFIGILSSLIAAIIFGWVKTPKKPIRKEQPEYTIPSPKKVNNSSKTKGKSVNKITANKKENGNIYFYTVVYDALQILISIFFDVIFFAAWYAKKEHPWMTILLLLYYLFISVASVSHLINIRSVSFNKIFDRFQKIQVVLGLTAFLIILLSICIWFGIGDFEFLIYVFLYFLLLPFVGILASQ